MGCLTPSPVVAVKQKVLLIEDNVDSAEMMQLLFEELGHSVSVAWDGQTGLELAEKIVPDTVFCDIGLPGAMNGYAVAKEIRRRQALSGIYLIALTGYVHPEDVRRAEMAGFDLHIAKPVGLDVLEGAVALRQHIGRVAT